MTNHWGRHRLIAVALVAAGTLGGCAQNNRDAVPSSATSTRRAVLSVTSGMT